ncbi:MAG: hypothetical protein AAFN70_06865 [Planctomycetota bacterium]
MPETQKPPNDVNDDESLAPSQRTALMDYSPNDPSERQVAQGIFQIYLTG